VMAGDVPPGRAESILQTFGTGANDKGLWAAARAARPVDRKALHDLKVEFVETAKIPPLAEAMVDLDHTWDNLKLAEQFGWRAPPSHPDIDPPHEALQLQEHFRELLRTEEVGRKPADFRKQLEESERNAAALHEALTAWKPTTPTGAAAPTGVAEAFRGVGNHCAACHKSYRD
jgi:hypothetical protein